jgi:Cof subfamily protein (haloacid dehalogenase superfamily)
MNRTLYITDLDGTLMDPTPRVTQYTARVINSLVDKGMAFSYATARSAVTAGPLTRNITSRIPIIVYNGAFILENSTNRILRSVFFDAVARSEIFGALSEHGVYPIVYSIINGVEKFSYVDGYVNPETRAFLDSRRGDIRENPVNDPKKLLAGEPFYFSCIGDAETLAPLYEKFRAKYSCVYQKDIYSGHQWLEIMPPAVSKASAILRLKEMMGCSRIVSFGDGINDVPMFEISDECYAVGNAVDALKKIATSVIGRNDEDGVAKWLMENVEL